MWVHLSRATDNPFMYPTSSQHLPWVLPPEYPHDLNHPIIDDAKVNRVGRMNATPVAVTIIGRLKHHRRVADLGQLEHQAVVIGIRTSQTEILDAVAIEATRSSSAFWVSL